MVRKIKICGLMALLLMALLFANSAVMSSVKSDVVIEKESRVRYDKDSYGAPTLYYDKQDAHRTKVERSLEKINRDQKSWINSDENKDEEGE
jgi:hypothetical protein